jgi:hypothetical protein
LLASAPRFHRFHILTNPSNTTEDQVDWYLDTY